MALRCKLCNAVIAKKTQVLEHYRLCHCNVSSVCQFPCFYEECICTFQSVNALKIHLTRTHNQATVNSSNQNECISFICPLCSFKQPFNDKTLLSHLRTHTKQHEVVDCPFKNCQYRTNVYSSFNAHKSRNHPDGDSSAFKSEILTKTYNQRELRPLESSEAGPSHESPELDTSDSIPNESTFDIKELQLQLKNNVSSLLLKMHSVLHVSETAIQDMVDSLLQIFTLSKPLVRETILVVLQEHNESISDAVLQELVDAITESNVFVSATTEGGELSTTKRRKTFVRNNYPLVMPIQHSLDSSRYTVYVPVLQMLQMMFKNTELLDKLQAATKSSPGVYVAHEDGAYFKANKLLSATGKLKLSLILYVDDVELANPLGTSRKIHKICAVYWLLANIPSQYRSSLHVIQLALLCKVSDLQKHSYETVLSPLLKDLQTLEQDGIFIEALGECIQGTVLCVAADNLAAHGLAGFVQSFRRNYICRFCCCTTEQIQTIEVSDGEFSMRTKESHDLHVQNVVQGEHPTHFGVTGDCALSKRLQHFHPITGFPPDILHDLFEGIVPVELALCIGEMIRRKYFTLEYLNTKIQTFPYQHSDRVDKPQLIPKNFASKQSIGGNGHENSTLLRLLPLMLGSKVPEGDDVWNILMDLKEIVQHVLSPGFTEESIQYMQTKICDHRQGLKVVFPDFRLRPKHHYLEHYPEMTKCFGPLVHLWTMRFEGKHRFFKRVIHDAKNFKNVLKTLATRHQYMMAYYLSAPAFFRPHIQASHVSSVPEENLPKVAKEFIKAKTNSQSIYSTSKVSVDGTEYAKGMFVSVGQTGGLPRFSKIDEILLIDNSVSFLCRNYECLYYEHLRSFELISSDIFSMHLLSELNDTLSLSAYNVDGRLLLTQKRFILIKNL